MNSQMKRQKKNQRVERDVQQTPGRPPESNQPLISCILKNLMLQTADFIDLKVARLA